VVVGEVVAVIVATIVMVVGVGVVVVAVAKLMLLIVLALLLRLVLLLVQYINVTANEISTGNGTDINGASTREVPFLAIAFAAAISVSMNYAI
jgi:hypothetical protein